MLAGVAAHDFINILKSRRGYRSMMLSSMHPDYHPLSHPELAPRDTRQEAAGT